MKKIIVLDIEGTILTDQFDKKPRPGLMHFLEFCKKVSSKICVMTAMPESNFRQLAAELCANDAVPEWFESIEYVPWENCKDLTLVSEKIENVIIVDDYPGNICTDQKDQWIQIAGYYEDLHDPDDRELERVQRILSSTLMAPGVNIVSP